VGIGLQGAYAVDAMSQHVRQRIQDQIAEEERQRNAALQARAADRADQSLAQQDELKRLQIDAQRANQAETQKNREEANVIRAVNLRPTGGVVSAAEQARETALGMPSALYESQGIPEPQAPEGIAAPGQVRGALRMMPDTIANSPAPSQRSYTFGETPAAEAKRRQLEIEQQKADADKASGPGMDAAAQDLYAKRASGQPLTPTESATLTGYEQRKRVVSDPAQLAATERQTNSIAAQTAQQSRAQGFTEAQAGRAALTKAEGDRATALASAQTMRDTIAAAQGGNMTAAALQNLETTMAAIRAQGLNRINTAEIGVTANAGSLWDRLQNWAGKATVGQPVDPTIQKDMTEFAGILEKGAHKKYLDAHANITTRYGLKGEKTLPAPGGPVLGEKRTANGETREWTGTEWRLVK
jgi:hypothetical protein